MAIDYFKLASLIADASKDPKYQVGAIILDKHGNIRSTGYNGAPRGVKDLSERYCKPFKQHYIAHAEENAIAQAARTGVSTDECSMVIWGKMPCATCVRMIIQAGISRVIFQPSDISQSSYKESFLAARDMLDEADISVVYIGE